MPDVVALNENYFKTICTWIFDSSMKCVFNHKNQIVQSFGISLHSDPAKSRRPFSFYVHQHSPASVVASSESRTYDSWVYKRTHAHNHTPSAELHRSTALKPVQQLNQLFSPPPMHFPHCILNSAEVISVSEKSTGWRQLYKTWKRWNSLKMSTESLNNYRLVY